MAMHEYLNVNTSIIATHLEHQSIHRTLEDNISVGVTGPVRVHDVLPIEHDKRGEHILSDVREIGGKLDGLNFPCP